MSTTVLVTPVDSFAAQCAALALRRAGVDATSDPAVDADAVVEFALPGGCPLAAEELSRDGRPRLLLLVSPEVDSDAVRLAEEIGAGGLLAWDSSTRAMVEAVDQLVQGRSVLPDVGRPDRTDPLASLTSRELQIVDLLEAGASNEAIGRVLGISYHTVRTHVAHVLEKLGVSHRYAAGAVVRNAARLGPVAAAAAEGGEP